MKKGCIFSVIFIALLAGCTTKNNNEDVPNVGDNGTTDTDSKGLTYENLFDPKSKIDIELKFKNDVIYKFAQYGTSGDFNKEEIYHPCDVTIKLNNETYIFGEVGARMKGNTSRYDGFIDEQGNFVNKERLCHFKLAFDRIFNSSSVNDYYSHEYTTEEVDARDSRRIASMKKIDLKWNKNFDSSFTKEIYALDCFRNEGVVSQNANLVNVTIKTEKDSVSMPYILYEVVDKTMIKKHFKGSKGDLYKCTYTNKGPADLASVQDDKFGVESFNFNPSYNLKTNEDTSNCEILKDFITKTSTKNISADKIKPKIDSVLDVDKFLKFAAMSWVVGSPDDYRNNYNNYYMYFDSNTNLANFIPYDNDRVFGIMKDWPIDTSTQSYSSDRLSGTVTSDGCGMPIVRRLLVSGSTSRPIIASYQKQYESYCKEFANKYLDAKKFKEFTDQFYYSSKIIDNSNSNLSFNDYAKNKLNTIN